MNDKMLNEYIDSLLGWSTQKRINSDGKWAELFDSAMARWVDRHPGTRPPAFAKLEPPPSCFTGEVPPLYKGELK